jgi:hypothetical protein
VPVSGEQNDTMALTTPNFRSPRQAPFHYRSFAETDARLFPLRAINAGQRLVLPGGVEPPSGRDAWAVLRRLRAVGLWFPDSGKGRDVGPRSGRGGEPPGHE